MHTRGSVALVLSLALCILLAAFMALQLNIVAFAEEWKPGTGCTKPTAADIAAGKSPDLLICDGDRKAYKDSGEAKLQLQQMLCAADKDNYGGAGAQGTIEGLDPDFAACAAKFLSFAKQSGKTVCIREGYRTVAKQNEYVKSGSFACKHGAGCEHPRGIAIDVNTDTIANYKWLHNNACQFGLDFYLRFKDKVHFVPLSHSKARGKASCPGASTVSCSDPNFKPSDKGSSGPAPSSGLSKTLRDALGLSPEPQPQPSPAPGQTLPQQAQPSQFFPPSSGGTSGGAGSPVSGGSGSPAGGSPVSELSPETQEYLGVTGGEGTYQPPVSIADELLKLAYDEPFEQPQNTGTTVPLYIDPDDNGTLGQVPNTPETSPAPVAPETSTTSLQPSETFVSPDLANSPLSEYAPFAPAPTGVFAVLENIKLILVRMLEILRPMGISAALLGEAGAVDEYAE